MRSIASIHVLVIGCMLAASLMISTQALGAEKLGLSVNASGVLIKDGKPFRAIGVNYYDAFTRRLTSPANTFYRRGFRDMAARNIRYARFMGCGYGGADLKAYVDDKNNYFTLMDDVIKAAEEYKIGLIPSMFWNLGAVPEMVGEPIAAWGDPQSKCRAFMRQYIDDMVGRYKNSPAIWAWECCNEWTLASDIPGRAGTTDQFSHDNVISAFTEFATRVRQLDPDRLILSGGSIPRSTAWHNSYQNSWVGDTRAQFAEILARDNPDPLNGISVHIYYSECNFSYFTDGKLSVGDFIKDVSAIARSIRKPLFIGEWGVGEVTPALSADETKAVLGQYIQAIEQGKVPLSAVWNYDGPYWDGNTITPYNSRAYILDMISQANGRIEQQLKNEQTAVPMNAWTLME